MSGLDIDTRSDIYSLGVLLYELLVGSTPLDTKRLLAAGLEGMRQMIRERDPVRPSTKLAGLTNDDLTTTAKRRSVEPSLLNQQLRGDLDAIVMKALEQDRSRRYETANGLAADIRRHLANEPVVARPPSTLYRWSKAVRRHRVAFAAAGLVLLSLLLGLGLATAAWRQTRTERDRAVAARSEAEAAQAGEAAHRQDAEAARARESRLRLEAEAKALVARRRAYATDLLRIPHELHAGNLRRARDLLARQIPADGQPDLRGWEWRYAWQLCRGDALAKLHQYATPIRFVGFAAGGQRMVTCDNDGGLEVFEATGSNEPVRLQDANPVVGRGTDAVKICLSADGKRVASVAMDGRGRAIRIWDLETFQVLRDLPFPGGRQPTGLGISPTGEAVAAYLGRDGVFVWEAASGKVLHRFDVVTRWDNGPGAVCFSPNGKRLAIGDADGRVRLLDLDGPTEALSYAASGGNAVFALAFSPNGRTLAAGVAFTDPRVVVWDLDGDQPAAVLEGHRGYVDSVAFSPDGRRLASAGCDQVIKVWNTTDWKVEATLLGHVDEVWSVTYSPDAHRLVSAGKDGSI
jgi:WD40 repeat protein